MPTPEDRAIRCPDTRAARRSTPRGGSLSSAILYVAIVAIWAGVLIPRWLRRDSSERTSDEVAVAQDTPVTQEEPVPVPARGRGTDVPRARETDAPRARETDAPRARAAGRAETAGARPGAAEGRSGAAVGRPGAVEARSRAGQARRTDVEGQAEDGHKESFRRPAHDQEHARVLTARRRLLMLLLVLTAGSCGLEVTGLAAWWVVVPPTVMLLGYLAMLREAAKADAERREQSRFRAAETGTEPLTANAPAAPAPAAPVPAPPPAPEAEIIDISASVSDGDEELYDQYADAKLRAVGD